MAPGGHFGFMQISKIAQSCPLGNQAEFVLGPHGNTNQEKNFIGKNISRLVHWAYWTVKSTRYPGTCLDFSHLIAHPQDHRILTLQWLIQELVSAGLAWTPLWQKFLCLFASLVDMVPNCRLFMRPLQLHLQQYMYFNQFFDPVSLQIP